MDKKLMKTLDQRTIEDFGEQWHQFTENEGFYGSVASLEDKCCNLMSVEDIRGKDVCEIGAGAGRFIGILSQLSPKSILAIEPSKAIEILQRNMEVSEVPIRYLNATGGQLDEIDTLDYVFSIGVIHHIVDPVPTLRAALKALRPGGRLLIWVYGYEGNELYLALVSPLRWVTKRLPDPVVRALSWVLLMIMEVYIQLCRFLPLPLRGYMVNVLGKFTMNKKLLAIFDQLNPAHAKYYKRDEIIEVVQSAGFINAKAQDRHGYSWSVIGEKPVKGSA
jgi:SAM-dependent methyltransferase